MPDGLFYHLESGEIGTLGAIWRGQGAFAKETNSTDGLRINTIKAEGVDFGEYFKIGDSLEISDADNNYGFYVVSDIKNILINFHITKNANTRISF